MPKLIDVKPLDTLKLYLKYDDGVEGEIKLEHLRKNIFYKDLCDPDYFSKAAIDQKTNDVIWENGVSLCKNAMYKQLQLKQMMKGFHIDLDKL